MGAIARPKRTHSGWDYVTSDRAHRDRRPAVAAEGPKADRLLVSVNLSLRANCIPVFTERRLSSRWRINVSAANDRIP
jgi:hypothetical protein